MSEKKALALIGLASVALLGFIFWLTYFHEPSAEAAPWTSLLAHINAFCNLSSATCLLIGYKMIRAGKREAHQKAMLSAVGFTIGFLLSYTLQHHFVGDTKFGGTGVIKILYFLILFSHILLSMLITPLVMAILFFALSENLEKHKKFARKTLPIWLYVCISGVFVYLFLSPYR